MLTESGRWHHRLQTGTFCVQDQLLTHDKGAGKDLAGQCGGEDIPAPVLLIDNVDHLVDPEGVTALVQLGDDHASLCRVRRTEAEFCPYVDNPDDALVVAEDAGQASGLAGGFMFGGRDDGLYVVTKQTAFHRPYLKQ